MPVLLVYGMRDELANTEALMQLFNNLHQVVASIEELEIQPSQVSVFFPRDCFSFGLGAELICFVVGLSETSRRTDQVRENLANAIRDTLRNFAKNNQYSTRLVEVFIQPFDRRNGFSQWEANQ